MSFKLSWNLDSLDSFILSFASNTEIENNKNAITCGSVAKTMAQEIMMMDYTTKNKSREEVLEQTKNNDELFRRFSRLYERVKSLALEGAKNG